MVTLHNYIDKRQSHSHTQIQTNQGFPYQYFYITFIRLLRKCFMLCNVAGEEIYQKVFRKRLVSGFRYIFNELEEETLRERRGKHELTLMYTILNYYKFEYLYDMVKHRFT